MTGDRIKIDESWYRLEDGIPVLVAEPTKDGQWRVWCCYCRRYHFHGAVMGHRTAHCSHPDKPHNSNPYVSTGYYLVTREVAKRLSKKRGYWFA